MRLVDEVIVRWKGKKSSKAVREKARTQVHAVLAATARVLIEQGTAGENELGRVLMGYLAQK